VRSGNADHSVKRVGETAMPEDLRTRTAPLLRLLVELQQELKAADARVAAIVAGNPVIQRLCTVPGVGPVTATAFVATVDDVQRFAGPHQLESFLGLVPSEKSSGERQHKGRITKAGNGRVRWLLVEAAWSVLMSRRENTEELRRWAQRIALRGGMKVAITVLVAKS
jgi:transposase